MLARHQRIYDFRPGQEDTMLYVLSGEDTLAIMPTGAGKSLCYQLCAQVLSGTALVVSPLISLMKDQHQKLERLGFVARHLSSELTKKQTIDAIRVLGEGRTHIQFITPEKLENPAILEAFKSAGVSLFVVDEAHCISEWGHDFRPAYLGLGKAIKALGHPPVLALTATATPEVTRDIQERLGFRQPSHVVRISYRRDNLLLRTREFRAEGPKYAALARLLQQFRGHAGIIYCASVKQVEALWKGFRHSGFNVEMYHGRMKKADRRRAQERFMRVSGTTMIATSAFGMGIDKPDVRFVINYQIPSSVESYYQEMGRAGRDGRKAYGIMYYTRKDKSLQRVLQLRKYPSEDFVRRAIEAIFLKGAAEPALAPVPQARIEEVVGKKRLGVVLQVLERFGFLRMNGRTINPILKPNDGDIAAILAEWDLRKSDDKSRLEDVVRYVHTNLCRWYYLLKYFGEELEEPCGTCDNCRKQAVLQSEAGVVPGVYVRHETWGVGEVVQKIGPNLRIFFPGIGEKVLRDAFVTPWRQAGHDLPRKVA